MPTPIYSNDFQVCFMLAFKIAQDYRHEYVLIEHILYALLHDEQTRKVLEACGADVDEMRTHLTSFFEDEVDQKPGKGDYLPEESLALQRVVSRAANQVLSSGKEVIDCLHILVALFSEEESHAVYFLQQEEVDRYDIVSFISHGALEDEDFDLDDFDEDFDEDDEDGNSAPEKKKDFLKKFTTNLTDKALGGELDEVVARDQETQRMIQILCRRSKNNPVLVGEPGVGKTAIVEGLAQRIADDKVPDQLKDSVLFSLDMGAVVAGTKFRGEFEERLKNIINALKEIPKSIVFLDELHTVMGAGATSGGTMDASNMLKPALSRGEIRCIGSTTFNEYKTNIQKDTAFARRFQKIDVKEPSFDDTYKILKGIKKYYEKHHSVTYPAATLKAAIYLSQRFISDRALPDKAIDILDEAGSAMALMPPSRRKKTITTRDIEKVVACMAMIPSVSVTAADKEKLVHLEDELKKVVYGQEPAIEAVSRAIKIARAGLRDEDKTYGSFLFVGPTGVGKTELSKQLADTMGINFIRFDMSEYQEKHSVSRLIGAPPGYVGFDQGGLLTDAISKTPHAVLLLDEIEKAHSDIYNILLQIMDNGKLTDNSGREADFTNVILIMTSNVGARDMASKLIGFENTENTGAIEKAVERHFSPELRNRLDSIVYFKPLTLKLMEKVVDKFIAKLERKLHKRNILFKLAPAGRKWLAEKGYEPAYGARPLARLIEREVKHHLTDLLLKDELEAGQFVLVDRDRKKDQLKITVKKLDELGVKS